MPGSPPSSALAVMYWRSGFRPNQSNPDPALFVDMRHLYLVAGVKMYTVRSLATNLTVHVMEESGGLEKLCGSFPDPAATGPRNVFLTLDCAVPVLGKIVVIRRETENDTMFIKNVEVTALLLDYTRKNMLVVVVFV